MEGEVSAVLEDRNGFIWLVAANGLWRWDSKALVKARFITSDSQPPPDTVYSGFTDQQEHLWITTERGLYRLVPGTTKLEAAGYEQLGNNIFLQGTAALTPDANVLVLATDKALYQYQHGSEHLQPIGLATATRIHALYVDTQQTLWVGTSEGLFNASLKQGWYEPLTRVTLDDTAPRISAITATQQGELVVGTAANGLFVKDEKGFQHLSLNEDAPPWMFSLVEVRPQVLLIGTFGDGLIELDLQTHQQRQFRHNRLLPAGLASNNIWSLLRDSRGLVWIGAGATLNVYNGASTAVEHIFGDINQPMGLSKRNVKALAWINGNLAVGAGQSGIALLTPHTGQTGLLWPSSGDPVETLFSGQNSLYASANFATVKLSLSSKEPEPLTVAGRTTTSFSTALAESSQALWIGGTDGLWQQPKGLSQPAVLLDSSRVASLALHNNTLWLGGWQGLKQGKLKNGLLTPDSLVPVNQAALGKKFIADLFTDSLGQLWVATSGNGVHMFNSIGEWQTIQAVDGLPGNDVVAIAGEHLGELWFSTSRSIAAIDIRDKTLRTVTSATDTINSPFARRAAVTTANGELIFGGENGLTVIRPALLKRPQQNLTMQLTQQAILTVDNQLIQPPGNDEHLNIAALPKRVSFEFIALDYLDPGHLSYRYRLQTSDYNWTELDSDHRMVTLTEPSPGSYQLEVEYSNDGYHWHPVGLTKPFTVLPAWYQTSYAAIAGIAGLIIAIYVLHQLGLRHYRHRQAMLEEKIAERTAALVKANEKLTEQAAILEEASLTDALTGLHNRRFISQNIQRDISRVHRYYDGCERTHTQPDDNEDMLFFVIDLDHFKRINDTYGHQTGDEVLVETKRRLASVFRDSDYLIRWGGEEFLAVVQSTSREEARIIADRVINAIGATPYVISQQSVLTVTCSVGFAAYPLHQRFFDAVDWQSTIGIADAALYRAKRRGRNTWTGVLSVNQNVSETTLDLITQQPSRVFDHATILIAR